MTLQLLPDGLRLDGEQLAKDRAAFLYLRASLGATPTPGGWVVPHKRRDPSWIVLRVHDWLMSHGYDVVAKGAADRAITLELEQRRSFQRTKQAAMELKEGHRSFDRLGLEQTLLDYGWRRSRVLRDHQLDGVAHALMAVNAANFSVPGSGKTATAIATIVAHFAAMTADIAVIVGPLACFDPWEREVIAAVGDRLRTRRVRGGPYSRQGLYEHARAGHVLLLSYATAAADQPALIRLSRRLRVVLVVDESHRVKKFQGGQWASAVMQVARYARVRLVLSGTPMPQSGRDLYSQLNILWPDGLLTGTRDAFAAQVETDFSRVIATVMPFVSRTPKETLGLPPYRTSRHHVELSGTQEEIYELICNQFRRRLQDAGVWQDKINTLRRGRPIRLLQAATNPALLNRRDGYYRLPPLGAQPPTLMERLANYGNHEVPAKSLAALDIVRSIVSEGKKVVCWSNFVANLDHFRQLVRERIQVPCFQIDGRVPAGVDALRENLDETTERAGEEDTREAIIDRFLRSPGPGVLVTNPASCSESISLHSSCHNAVYLDRTYDCALFLQSVDRIHRLGLPEDAHVNIHILVATVNEKPTVDGLVDDALTAKDSRMRLLLEGAELGPINLADDPSTDAEGDREDLDRLLHYLLGEA